MTLLAASAAPQWEKSDVWQETFEDSRLRVETRTVNVPIVGAGGKRLGVLIRHTGSGIVKTPDQVSSVEIEERVQLAYRRGGKTVTVLLDETGRRELAEFED